MPPGPPTLPFLGNLHQIPSSKFAEYCSSLRSKYGGIISLKTGPGTIIVLQDAKAVKELCDKKSSIYSSRPPSYVINELIVDHDHLLFLPYGKQWQQLAKLMKTELSADRIKLDHRFIQDAEAIETIYQILEDRQSWFKSIKRFSTSVITTIVFGIRGPVYDHWMVRGIYSVYADFAKDNHISSLHRMSRWGEIIEPGATPPIDLIPVLKYIPEWAAPWRKWAQTLRKMMNGMYGGLWQICQQRHADHALPPCLAKTLIESPELGLTDHQIAFFLGPLMEGGSETTAGSLLSFILAMIHKPDVQAKAHAEMDKVVDEDRSPTLDDWEKLPYLRQIQKEVLRWRPAITAGIPHYLSQDDQYEGFFLPKGSTAIVNTLGLHMDEARWTNPQDFNPDRYKDYTGLANELAVGDHTKRDHYAYGAGRRFCHGVHLAERNLYNLMAKLIWAFEFIAPAGSTVNVDNYTTGLLSKPHPFPLEIKARSCCKYLLALMYCRSEVNPANGQYDESKRKLGSTSLANIRLLTSLTGFKAYYQATAESLIEHLCTCLDYICKEGQRPHLWRVHFGELSNTDSSAVVQTAMERIELCTESDLAQVLDLFNAMGWDLLRSDVEHWTFADATAFKAVSGSRIVGVNFAYVQGSHASIGGLAVLPEFRNKGIGKQLMHATIEGIRPASAILIASPAGLPVYRKMGFEIYTTVIRCDLASFSGVFPAVDSDIEIRQMLVPDKDTAVQLASKAVGFDRSDTMKVLFGTTISSAVCIRQGAIVGLACLWQRKDVLVIGPVIAQSSDQAIALMHHLFTSDMDAFKNKPMRVDIRPDAAVEAWLTAAGFSMAEREPCMVRGSRPCPVAGFIEFAIVNGSRC